MKKQGDIVLEVRSKWGVAVRLPKLGCNHYRIFRKVYTRRESLMASLRLIRSTFAWRFFRYDNSD